MESNPRSSARDVLPNGMSPQRSGGGRPEPMMEAALPCSDRVCGVALPAGRGDALRPSLGSEGSVELHSDLGLAGGLSCSLSQLALPHASAAAAAFAITAASIPRSALQLCQLTWQRLRRWVCERRKAVPMPRGMAMPTRCSNFGCSLRPLRRSRRRRRGAPQRRRCRQQRRRGRRRWGGGCGAEGATRRAAPRHGGSRCMRSAERPAPTVALA
mmetsp:Transcript_44979/g.144119  ORF Transcript_44979/g.144119 Transcript_44979/m.144119 type:complete len:214 (+) Transcript_44979:314-955(+)